MIAMCKVPWEIIRLNDSLSSISVIYLCRWGLPHGMGGLLSEINKNYKSLSGV